MVIQNKTDDRFQLYKLLTDHFDSSELQTLAFDLGVDYDNLGGEGKMSKARELIIYAERHGWLGELIGYIKAARPYVGQEDILLPTRTANISESSDPRWIKEFFQQVEEIEQQLNTILTVTNLDPDQANDLLNQFKDTPDKLLLNLLDLDASPELIQYTIRFAKIEYLFGCYLVAQGRWYEGLKYLERSLVLRRRLNNLDELADSIYQIGRTHHLMGNLEESRIRYRDARRLYEQTDNLVGISACQMSLGSLDIQLGFIYEGVESLKQSRVFYSNTNNEEKIKEIDTILNLVQNLQEKQPI